MSEPTTQTSPLEGVGRRDRTAALLIGLLVIGGYLWHVSGYWRQVSDDAFVTFRYSRNLAEGRGPYFNPGERVEGYNNFLFMLEMSAAIALFGPDEAPFVAKLLGVDGGLGAILGAWLLAALWLRTIPPLRAHAFSLAWIAGGLLAVNAAFAVQTTTGLGTLQYAALLTIGLLLLQWTWQTGRWSGAGVLFALALLSRPEAVLILAGVWVGRCYAGEWRFARRHLLLDSLITGGTLAGYLVFRFLAYDGQFVPNTFYAKLGGFTRMPEIEYLAAFLRAHLGGIFVIFGIVPLLAGRGSRMRSVLPATFALAGGTLAVLLSGSDAALGFRFLVPYAPIWAALATLGVCLAGVRIRQIPRLGSLAIGALLMVSIWLTQLDLAGRYHENVVVRARGYQLGHVALAAWLQERAEPGDTVATLDPGVLGYNCMDLRVLDLTGVTSAEIGRAPGPFMRKQIGPGVILDQRPEFIVIVNMAPWEGSSGPGMGLDPQKLHRRAAIEEAVIHAPQFAAHYDRQRPPARPTSAPTSAAEANAAVLEALTALLGAEAIFVHDFPRQFYLLTVYQRHGDAPRPAPARTGEG